MLGAVDAEGIVEVGTVRVRDAEVESVGPWVYVWLRRGALPEVLHVGATTLDPHIRTWLHLHHDDPAVGRVRHAHEPNRLDDVDVVAFRLTGGLDRAAVRDAVADALRGQEMSTPAPADEGPSIGAEERDAAAAIVGHLGRKRLGSSFQA